MSEKKITKHKYSGERPIKVGIGKTVPLKQRLARDWPIKEDELAFLRILILV
jgi:hypothetical protein